LWWGVRVRKVILPLLLLFLTAGCGYKSSRSYVKNLFGDRVYTEVKVYLRDPQNSVLIKDAINKAVIEKFGSRLVAKEIADTKIYATLKELYFIPLEYNSQGYIVYYRTKVIMGFRVQQGLRNRFLTTEGIYDFQVEPNSVITDTLRFIAIKEAANKALDRFISKVSFLGAK